MTPGRNKLIPQKHSVDKLIAQKQFVDNKHSQGPLASLTCISYWLRFPASCWLAALTGFSCWPLLLASLTGFSYWLLLLASLTGFPDWLFSIVFGSLRILYVFLSVVSFFLIAV